MRISKDTRSVYIIYNPEVKRTKIGFSNNPKRRFNEIVTMSGCKLRLLYCSYPIYNYVEVEHNMHVLFNDARYMGEWFNIEPNNPIKRLKAMLADKNKCRIVKWFDDGVNASEIARKIGVSRSGVVKYLAIHDRIAFKKGSSKNNDKEAQIIVNKSKPLTSEQIKSMVERANNKKRYSPRVKV